MSTAIMFDRVVTGVHLGESVANLIGKDVRIEYDVDGPIPSITGRISAAQRVRAFLVTIEMEDLPGVMWRFTPLDELVEVS